MFIQCPFKEGFIKVKKEFNGNCNWHPMAKKERKELWNFLKWTGPPPLRIDIVHLRALFNAFPLAYKYIGKRRLNCGNFGRFDFELNNAFPSTVKKIEKLPYENSVKKFWCKLKMKNVSSYHTLSKLARATLFRVGPPYRGNRPINTRPVIPLMRL